MPPKKTTAPKESLTARVDRDFKKRVARYALDHDMEIQDLVIQALEDYLKKHGA